MKHLSRTVFVICVSLICCFTQNAAGEEIPKMLNFQGRVAVGGQPFTGNGQFKFALVNAEGNQTFWSNDNTSVNGSQPVSGVAVFVRDGIYNILLGGGAMQAIPESVFADRSDVFLRVWFNDNTHGFEHLEPDQRIVSVAYSYRAAVADTVKHSGRTVITGELDSRLPGDEYEDKFSYNLYLYGGLRYIYGRYGKINIPVADLDTADLPITQIYWAATENSDKWHDSLIGLVIDEGRGIETTMFNVIQYITYTLYNGKIQLCYPHLLDRNYPDSIPYISYIGGSPSYNVFYKIVIMK
ncbi:MAG: hypothetical protein RBU23_00095 [Candidatus Auribacterota bacterium]|jgi:hypothetical protein|nr:hypothetical protein [Candidatus Auribacterota bacterium]